MEARENSPQSPRKHPDEPKEEEAPEDQETPLDSLECEICGNGYSNNRLPLIIKACGHTVCENCIDILQEKSDWNCPSCRQFSNVQVNDLPVNQSLLDYILDRDRFDALACIQCNFRFNEEREPLVLRECGHSICQSCVTTLGKNGFIVCMPCRKISFLSDAKTGQLPKNYAVLSVIRELNK
ncbi:hypothetical protein CAEBREN_12875 [Caenorhabditis brenneri]|uniref:RING-type domain-containing protein n=1 Tax=Caenorhabditis brenneri TaxID=135651 RepID=G0MWV5_CAEBE|nr:hypothetical protein CAEBREN_12875 [Caenorhabditis brenneri]